MVENNSQLARLKVLEEKGVKTSGKSVFNGLVVCNLGVKAKEHYPKLKNADGTAKKNADGNTMHSEQSDGWLYTFSEFGTCNKVMIVLPKKFNLELMTAYSVSGLGYSMRSSNMIYIDENAKIANY